MNRMTMNINPFFIMFVGSILYSMVFMPFTMIDSPSDFRVSPSQLYSAVSMSAAMVLLETVMHPLSLTWTLITVFVFIVSLICLRYQVGVTDTEYLHDMIPHHSMAVLTSKAILKKTQNKEIYDLAEKILRAQREGLMLMKRLASY